MNTTQSRFQAAPTLLPTLAILGAVALWGASFSVMKALVAVLPPESVMLARQAGACLAVACFLPRLSLAGYRKGDWKWLGLFVFFMPCAYFLLESNALTLTTSSQAGVISASVPLLVALGARMVLGEPLTRRTLAGLALSMAGVCWLTLAGAPDAQAPNPLLGNVLELLAMLCAAGSIIVLKRLSSRFGSWTLTAMQTFAGLVFFLPGLPGLVGAASELSAAQVGGLVFLGVGVTLGAFGLHNYGISRLPAARGAAPINLVPVVAVVLGWAALGEALNPAQMLAAVTVLAGVFLSQWQPRTRRGADAAAAARAVS
jgi:drug/metabolite transporter (DMT)-like permease